MRATAARQALSLRAAPPRSTELSQRGDLLWIESQYLEADPGQPRRTFDEDTLTELTDSITEVGVLTPLRVRPGDPATGLHTITDGERRWRAGQRVGVVAFPCLVEAADAGQAFLEAYLANLHRDALTPVDAAVGVQHIRETFHLAGDEEVAARLKKSVGWVRQMNAVLALDAETRRVLQERGEPVAIAVGLRPQLPAERHATLRALEDLPSRDAKVQFIGRVNDHRRAGRPIDEAIAAVCGASEPSPAPDVHPDPAEEAPRQRTGRPRRWTAAFGLSSVDGITLLEVMPAGLAVTGLSSRRTVTHLEWCEAMAHDLAELRRVCALDASAGQTWEETRAALEAVLQAHPGAH